MDSPEGRRLHRKSQRLLESRISYLSRSRNTLLPQSNPRPLGLRRPI